MDENITTNIRVRNNYIERSVSALRPADESGPAFREWERAMELLSTQYYEITELARTLVRAA